MKQNDEELVLNEKPASINNETNSNDGKVLSKEETGATDSFSSSSSSSSFSSASEKSCLSSKQDVNNSTSYVFENDGNEEEEGVNDAGTRDFLDWLEDEDDDYDDEAGEENEKEEEEFDERNDEMENKGEMSAGETESKNEDHASVEEEEDDNDEEDDEVETLATKKNEEDTKDHDNEASSGDNNKSNSRNSNTDKDPETTTPTPTPAKPSSSSSPSSKKAVIDKSEHTAIQIGTTALLNRLCNNNNDNNTTTSFDNPKDASDILHSLRSFVRRDARLVVRIIMKNFSSSCIANNNTKKSKNDGSGNLNATYSITFLMRKHASDALVQEEGCAVLCNLCSIPTYCKFIGQYNDGAISVLLESLAGCGMEEVKVAQAGLTALSNLCRCGGTTIRQKVVSFGAIEVVQDVMVSHSENSSIRDRGVKTLNVMLPPPLTPEEIEMQKQEKKEEEEANNLNACYEALEKMRRLNLEVELGTSDIDFKHCTQCLRDEHYQRLRDVQEGKQQQQQQPQLQQHLKNSGAKFQRLLSSAKLSGPTKRRGSNRRNSKNVVVNKEDSNKGGSSSSNSNNNNTNDDDDVSNDNHSNNYHPSRDVTTNSKNSNTSKTNSTPNKSSPKNLKKIIPKIKAKPCLICGSPSCSSHSCPTFLQKKDGLVICCNCAPLFTLDFIIDCVAVGEHHHHHHDHGEKEGGGSGDSYIKQKQQKFDQMIAAYDRALLILRYSTQYLDDISDALRKNTKRNNHIGLGSSATGIVSGITGVAAAAAIFTPAGPPLLIASLLFGGSATAASTSSEAVNYYSEPNRLADKIIALHTMVHSILRVSGVLRDALLRNHIRLEDYVETGNSDKRGDLVEIKETLEQIQTTLDKESVKIPLQASRSTVNYAVAGAEIGILASRNARFFSRATTNVMRSARVARFAGGALSAATIVLDANEMRNSVLKIKAGNVCEKADLLFDIKEEANEFPDTAVLSGACDKYLEIMSRRRKEERRMEDEGGEEIVAGECGDALGVTLTHQGIE